MTTHELKTTPAYFAPVWDGSKPFEIRYDDRAYQPGDQVVLVEWDPRAVCTTCPDPRRHNDAHCERFSGRTIDATIGHLSSSTPARGSQRGFEGHGYVVFALLNIECHDAPPVSQGEGSGSSSASSLVEEVPLPSKRSHPAELLASLGSPTPRNPPFATGGRVGPRSVPRIFGEES